MKFEIRSYYKKDLQTYSIYIFQRLQIFSLILNLTCKLFKFLINVAIIFFYKTMCQFQGEQKPDLPKNGWYSVMWAPKSPTDEGEMAAFIEETKAEIDITEDLNDLLLNQQQVDIFLNVKQIK
eukprot:TRINITY_DN6774_c1_g1_i1.p2 TRINITY_DN6774_c1_g1~~TRINITY_DN6774_c1_g1_i1.p2  ORF type:complete len:132 (+),score=2.77 TRINITY_DN6774_c1_g1_i1:28-396(+)